VQNQFHILYDRQWIVQFVDDPRHLLVERRPCFGLRRLLFQPRAV